MLARTGVSAGLSRTVHRLPPLLSVSAMVATVDQYMSVSDAAESLLASCTALFGGQLTLRRRTIEATARRSASRG